MLIRNYIITFYQRHFQHPKNRLKIPLTSFKVHPKYNAFCSYDIAIAKFDAKALSRSLSEKQLKLFLKSLKKHIPPLGSVAQKACIEIVGHTISGIQLVSKGRQTANFRGVRGHGRG